MEDGVKHCLAFSSAALDGRPPPGLSGRPIRLLETGERCSKHIVGVKYIELGHLRENVRLEFLLVLPDAPDHRSVRHPNAALFLEALEDPLERHVLGAGGQPFIPDDLGASLDQQLSQVVARAPRRLTPAASCRTGDDAETA